MDANATPTWNGKVAQQPRAPAVGRKISICLQGEQKKKTGGRNQNKNENWNMIQNQHSSSLWSSSMPSFFVLGGGWPECGFSLRFLVLVLVLSCLVLFFIFLFSHLLFPFFFFASFITWVHVLLRTVRSFLSLDFLEISFSFALFIRLVYMKYLACVSSCSSVLSSLALRFSWFVRSRNFPLNLICSSTYLEFMFLFSLCLVRLLNWQ